VGALRFAHPTESHGIRHSGAMRSIEIWWAIAHLRISRFRTGCPGMTLRAFQTPAESPFKTL
jgi:hypothetical protein